MDSHGFPFIETRLAQHSPEYMEILTDSGVGRASAIEGRSALGDVEASRHDTVREERVVSGALFD